MDSEDHRLLRVRGSLMVCRRWGSQRVAHSCPGGACSPVWLPEGGLLGAHMSRKLTLASPVVFRALVFSVHA